MKMRRLIQDNGNGSNGSSPAMNNGHRPPNHSHSSPEEHAKLVRANLFRKHLRDADKSILEGNFDKAWLQLAEAAKLEPNHQMLVAFKERLEHVQQKTSASDPSPPAAAPTTESGINPESIGKNGNGRADGTIPAGESRPVSAAEPLAPPPAATNTAFEAASQALNEVQSELDTLRRALEGECEKGVKLEKELSDARGTEQELRKKFETERAEAQERLKTETGAALEAEQKLAEENEKARQEFDRKLELLGVKISQSKDERLARYREKLKHVYESGTPSADGEQMLKELRKLLQVTPEEH